MIKIMLIAAIIGPNDYTNYYMAEFDSLEKCKTEFNRAEKEIEDVSKNHNSKFGLVFNNSKKIIGGCFKKYE